MLLAIGTGEGFVWQVTGSAGKLCRVGRQAVNIRTGVPNQRGNDMDISQHGEKLGAGLTLLKSKSQFTEPRW